jgi:ABC-type transporter Mla subunit MlaD
MNGDRQKFWLGVFALATLGMLAILITFFGGFLDLFVSQYHYSVKFPQAPGVEPGTLVRKSGVRIGEVQSITLNPDTGEVVIEFSVARKHQLRVGDQPLLGRGLLMGDTVINFVPEGGDRELAPEGHVFQGKVSQDISQALAKTGELVPVTKDTLDEIRAAAKALNQLVPDLRRTNGEAEVALHNFGKASESVDNVIRGNQDRLMKGIDQFVETAHQFTLLLNEDNQRQINATIKNIRQATENLAGFMTEDNRRNVNDLLKNAKNASDQLAKILTDENEKNLNALLKNLKTSSDNLDQTMKKADQLMTEARADLRTVSDRADSVGKNVEEMVKDARTVVKRLNDTMANADQMVADIRQATKPIAERAPRILKNVDESTAQLNLVLLQAGDMIRFLQESDGTMHRLVADPALYNSINEAAAAISKSAGRLDRIVQDFAIFADKVARHPELLGVSGAVQPSTGLKH